MGHYSHIAYTIYDYHKFNMQYLCFSRGRSVRFHRFVSRSHEDNYLPICEYGECWTCICVSVAVVLVVYVGSV